MDIRSCFNAEKIQMSNRNWKNVLCPQQINLHLFYEHLFYSNCDSFGPWYSQTTLKQLPMIPEKSVHHNQVSTKRRLQKFLQNWFHRVDSIFPIYIPETSWLSLFRGFKPAHMVDINNKKTQTQHQRENCSLSEVICKIVIKNGL